MATLTAIVQDVVDLLGLPRPASLIDSTDQTARTLLAHSNSEGRHLAREAEWSILTRVHSFATVASTAEYALPSDYTRLKHDTEWDETNKWPLLGPTDSMEWRSIKSSGLGASVVGSRFRIFRASSGNTRKIYIDPTPTAVATLSFEYQSNQWCAKSDGTLQSAWVADTDVTLVDDELMRLGLLVRYRRSKGLSFASEADEYMQVFNTLFAQDKPAKTLSMTPQTKARLLGYDNLPSTGYTGPV